MRTFADFQALARRLKDPGDATTRVSMVQCSPQWAADPKAVDLRDEIDDLILRRLLRAPNDVVVRRIVLYDLPGRGQPGSPDDAHRTWIDRLRRDLGYLGADSPAAAVDYTVKQLVLATLGAHSRPPADVATTGDGGSRFAHADRRKSFPLTSGETRLRGPYPDEDPLYYVDLEITDLDRLQIGVARRAARARAGRRGWLPGFRRPG